MADDAVIPIDASDDWISGFAETQARLNDPAYRVHAEFGGQETADAFVLGQNPERLDANDPSTWGAARAEVATLPGEKIEPRSPIEDQSYEYSHKPGEPEMRQPVTEEMPAAPETQEPPEIALTDILGDQTIPINNEGEAALHALSGAGDAINQVLQISDEVIQVVEGSSVGRWLESVGLGNAYIVWDGEGLRFQQGRPENVPLAQLPTYKMDDPPMVADLSRAVTHFVVAMAALRTRLPGAGVGIGTAQGVGREVISSAGAAATFDPTEGGLVTMLKSMGVESEFLAYLDAQVPEGSKGAERLEGRLMLAVEDIIVTGGLGALFIGAARALKSAPKLAAGVAEDLKAAGVSADRLGNTLNNAASYVEGKGAEAMQRLQVAGAGKIVTLRHAGPELEGGKLDLSFTGRANNPNSINPRMTSGISFSTKEGEHAVYASGRREYEVRLPEEDLSGVVDFFTKVRDLPPEQRQAIIELSGRTPNGVMDGESVGNAISRIRNDIENGTDLLVERGISGFNKKGTHEMVIWDQDLLDSAELLDVTGGDRTQLRQGAVSSAASGATMHSVGGAITDAAIAGAGKVASKLKGVAREPIPEINMAPEGARGHKLPSPLLMQGSGAPPQYKVTQGFSAANKAANFLAIDEAKAAHPQALMSPENWTRFQQDTLGGEVLPVPPMQAITYAKSPQAMADKLANLTPEMKAGVDEGFSNVAVLRDMYKSGEADPETTANLFVWGILSRGAGPVQQESAYIDIIGDAAEFIQKTVDGTFNESDGARWLEVMRTKLPEGSPGKQVTMNVNSAGTLLRKLAMRPEGSDKTVLQTLHEMIGDENVSAREIRRAFVDLTEGAGIDNKVVSFLLLVSGRDDVLVMDRIQSRHLWDDGRFEGYNIYDGYTKAGTTAKEGLQGIARGPRGLLITEALEDGLRANVQEAYQLVGREGDASLGRFHWESWVIDGEQVVDHETLKAVATKDPVGVGVREGKPGTFSSGMRYLRGESGTVVEYPLSNGDRVHMSPTRMKEFEAFIKNPKNAIVPKGFKVTERTDVRWYERPEVDRAALDAAARDFANADAQGKIVRRTTKP